MTPNRLAVLLTCAVPESDEDLDVFVRGIRQKLVDLGVRGAWDRAELVAWLRDKARNGPQLDKEVLIEGKPGTPPIDGAIEWAQDFFSSGFVVDDATGAIDYRQHAAQRSVAEGQLLARIKPATPGIDGEDVFGNPLPVRNPKTPNVTARRNVRVGEEGASYYATVAGRLSWEPKDPNDDTMGGVLSVDEVYTVAGSVNLETGNISHPGAVVVERDVEEGTRVEAEGDIEVRGVVERAFIKTRGDLTVLGGITGCGRETIEIGGSVHARFILEADIEAGGDIVVEREVRHATLKTCGAVSMPQGHVVGGTVTALKGITVGYAGSDAVVPTVLVTGVDYRLERSLEAKQEEITRLEGERQKIQLVVKPFVPRIRSLSAQKRQVLAKLLREIKATEEAIGNLQGEMEEMRAATREEAEPSIRIQNHVYPETTFYIGKEPLKMAEAFPGPAVVRLTEGRVVLLAASS